VKQALAYGAQKEGFHGAKSSAACDDACCAPLLRPLTEDVSHLRDQGTDRASRPSHLVLVEGRRLYVWSYEWICGGCVRRRSILSSGLDPRLFGTLYSQMSPYHTIKTSSGLCARTGWCTDRCGARFLKATLASHGFHIVNGLLLAGIVWPDVDCSFLRRVGAHDSPNDIITQIHISE